MRKSIIFIVLVVFSVIVNAKVTFDKSSNYFKDDFEDSNSLSFWTGDVDWDTNSGKMTLTSASAYFDAKGFNIIQQNIENGIFRLLVSGYSPTWYYNTLEAQLNSGDRITVRMDGSWGNTNLRYIFYINGREITRQTPAAISWGLWGTMAIEIEYGKTVRIYSSQNSLTWDDIKSDASGLKSAWEGGLIDADAVSGKLETIRLNSTDGTGTFYEIEAEYFAPKLVYEDNFSSEISTRDDWVFTGSTGGSESFRDLTSVDGILELTTGFGYYYSWGANWDPYENSFTLRDIRDMDSFRILVDGGCGQEWSTATSSIDFVDGNSVKVEFQKVWPDLRYKIYVNGLLDGEGILADAAPRFTTGIQVSNEGKSLLVRAGGATGIVDWDAPNSFAVYDQTFVQPMFTGRVKRVRISSGMNGGLSTAKYYNIKIEADLKAVDCDEVLLFGEVMKGDVNSDCIVNLLDLVELSHGWLLCNDLSCEGVN